MEIPFNKGIISVSEFEAGFELNVKGTANCDSVNSSQVFSAAHIFPFCDLM